MTRPRPLPAARATSRDGTGIEEILAGIVVGGIAAAALCQWLIGNLAALLGHGRRLPATPIQALASLGRLPHHLSNPRSAWPAPARASRSGPVLYWLATVLVAATLVAIAAVLLRLLAGRQCEPIDKRRRLGVPTQARFATTADLRSLLTKRPESGRLMLARRGRRYVCTEAASFRGRRGVAGAVAVFGPSQSGKTTGLIDSLHAWTGPAIVSSVKADLLRATIDTRRAAGDVAVFDPLGVTGLPTGSWSPLRAAGTCKPRWEPRRSWPAPAETTDPATGSGAAKPNSCLPRCSGPPRTPPAAP